MCEYISKSYTFVSWSSPLTLSLRKLRRASLDRIEAYVDKGNFIRSKRERSFLRNFFLFCEFISQGYNLCLQKQFDNTVFVESGKWYFVAHMGPWWKRKCPHKITTGNFLRDYFLMCEFITQISTLSFLEQFANTVFVESGKWYFVAHMGPWWKRKCPHKITTGNFLRDYFLMCEFITQISTLSFLENALRCMNATHRVTLFSSVIRLLPQFSWNLQWDIS